MIIFMCKYVYICMFLMCSFLICKILMMDVNKIWLKNLLLFFFKCCIGYLERKYV